MMPCMRLYGFLGCQLAAAYPRTHSEWVRIYAAPSFTSLPRRQEQLLDRIGPSAPFGEPGCSQYHRADYASCILAIPLALLSFVLQSNVQEPCLTTMASDQVWNAGSLEEAVPI